MCVCGDTIIPTGIPFSLVNNVWRVGIQYSRGYRIHYNNNNYSYNFEMVVWGTYNNYYSYSYLASFPSSCIVYTLYNYDTMIIYTGLLLTSRLLHVYMH